MSMITQEELKRLLYYDEFTGIFIWIVKPSRIVNIGSAAGTVHKIKSGKSYVFIRIKRKAYKAHRLAFLYVTGSLPENEVDHLNGDGTDNRLCNLRMVSKNENSKNLRRYSSNSSGISGVYWNKRENKWRDQIMDNCKNKMIGRFDNIFDAASARKSAEIEFGYHKNHGSSRPL